MNLWTSVEIEPKEGSRMVLLRFTKGTLLLLSGEAFLAVPRPSGEKLTTEYAS
jgi:hypothetical protein